MDLSGNVALIALFVSLIALIIALGQLLISVFSTAEGFRRTNAQVMGAFAQTRDRVFHLTEFRYETRFSTPHFTFHSPDDDSSLLSTWNAAGTNVEGDWSRSEAVYVLAIDTEGNIAQYLDRLIKLSARISKLQRFLNWFGQPFATSHGQLISRGSRAYSAGWLLLMEQLYEDAAKFHQHDEKVRFQYRRSSDMSFAFGPNKTEVRYPAIESHVRSWDLFPPEIVRPIASISLGDLLTLCFRLRITVRNYGPLEFVADGGGHNFSALQIQGLGMVLQYRYDKRNDTTDPQLHANGSFVPCEAADKLAFSIIPRNVQLGMHHDWPIAGEPSENDFTGFISRHFQRLGLSRDSLHMVTSNKERDKNDVWQTFSETLLLLAPFLPIDGLGIVKYQPPIPPDWMNSLLYIREGRIVLRHRLNQKFPDLLQTGFKSPAMPPSRTGSLSDPLRWIGAVLNHFERKNPRQWQGVPSLHIDLLKNAHNESLHQRLKELRKAYTETDNYLASLFNQQNCIPTYQYLVAAHHEMAITVHSAVHREIRNDPRNNDGRQQHLRCADGFRDGTKSPGVWLYKTEMMHRYIEHAIEKKTIIEAYRSKMKVLMDDPSGKRPADLSDEQIRAGWFAMMLRGCLWGWTHFPIFQRGLPYPARYWEDSTPVLIA